jgi:hypothetical protein
MDKPLTDLQSFLLAVPYLQHIEEKAILKLSQKFGIKQEHLSLLIKVYYRRRPKNE